MVKKILKTNKKYFPTIFSIHDFRINYNPNKPETDKIGIRVRENLVLIGKYLKQKKIIFPLFSVFRNFRINYNPD